MGKMEKFQFNITVYGKSNFRTDRTFDQNISETPPGKHYTPFDLLYRLFGARSLWRTKSARPSVAITSHVAPWKTDVELGVAALHSRVRRLSIVGLARFATMSTHRLSISVFSP